MPVLPSWLTEPLRDQSAALLPERTGTTRTIRWAVTKGLDGAPVEHWPSPGRVEGHRSVLLGRRRHCGFGRRRSTGHAVGAARPGGGQRRPGRGITALGKAGVWGFTVGTAVRDGSRHIDAAPSPRRRPAERRARRMPPDHQVVDPGVPGPAHPGPQRPPPALRAVQGPEHLMGQRRGVRLGGVRCPPAPKVTRFASIAGTPPALTRCLNSDSSPAGTIKPHKLLGLVLPALSGVAKNEAAVCPGAAYGDFLIRNVAARGEGDA